MAALLAGTGTFVGLRWMRRKSAAETGDEEEPLEIVEEAGLESFPASDPPSWTLGEDRSA